MYVLCKIDLKHNCQTSRKIVIVNSSKGSFVTVIGLLSPGMRNMFYSRLDKTQDFIVKYNLQGCSERVQDLRCQYPVLQNEITKDRKSPTCK